MADVDYVSFLPAFYPSARWRDAFRGMASTNSTWFHRTRRRLLVRDIFPDSFPLSIFSRLQDGTDKRGWEHSRVGTSSWDIKNPPQNRDLLANDTIERTDRRVADRTSRQQSLRRREHSGSSATAESTSTSTSCLADSPPFSPI
jgi:hypothetical protein